MTSKLDRRDTLKLGAAAVAVGATRVSAQGTPFDIVIRNGRVMDPETGFDQVANVGIRDGMIEAIASDEMTGTRVIDATGHAVAPGFIDTHFHNVTEIGAKLAVRDGVTSAMDLEFGALGSRVEEWYAARDGKWVMNYGTTSSHELARSLIMDGFNAIDVAEGPKSRAAGTGWSHTQPSLEQGNALLAEMDEGLRAGAIGIGSTLGYMRDGATAREVWEMQKTAGRYGRLTSVHLRLTPGTATGEVNSMQEVLSNAILLNAPLIVCHFNNPGWRLVHEMLIAARARGANIWGEIYPYAAGSTALNAVFLQPEIWIDQLGNKYEETLLDPSTDEFITREKYDELMQTDPTRIIVVYKMPEEDVAEWLRLPGVSVGSDAMISYEPWDTPFEEMANVHPRTAGAHAAALRIGRENGVPLMQTLSQLSHVSAHHLGKAGLEMMKTRGRMQQGMVADITIFDPDTVTDNATYENGTLPSTGIPYVIVNGQIVVDDSVVLDDVKPGQPVRYAVEDTGRHEPLVIDDWNERFMPADFGGVPEHSVCCQFTY